MTFKKIPPLDWQTPIVDDQYRPSLQFMRLWQDSFANGSFTNDTATDALTQVIAKADKTTTLTAGTGLSGGGDLSGNRTFSLNASIDLLSDVDTSTTVPTNGQALIWNSTTHQWVPGAAGASTLNALTNYDNSVAPLDGQVVVWNASTSKWKPGTVVSTLNALTNYDDSVAPTDGQAVVWNTSSSKWKPGTVGGTASFRGARVELAADNAAASGDRSMFIASTTVNFDTDSFWDSTNRRFVIPVGVTKVRVEAQMYRTSSTGVGGIRLKQTGSVTRDFMTDYAAGMSLIQGGATIDVVAGDVITLNGNTASSLVIGKGTGSSPWTWATIEVLAATNSSSSSGTVFPSSPAAGQTFFRTDRKLEYVWDGTRWLSTNEYALPFSMDAGVTATGVVIARRSLPQAGRYSIYVTDVVLTTFKTATSSWDAYLNYASIVGGTTTFALANTNGDTINNWTHHLVAVNALMNAAAYELEMGLTKVSGTATAYCEAVMYYRLVG